MAKRLANLGLPNVYALVTPDIIRKIKARETIGMTTHPFKLETFSGSTDKIPSQLRVGKDTIEGYCVEIQCYMAKPKQGMVLTWHLSLMQDLPF